MKKILSTILVMSFIVSFIPANVFSALNYTIDSAEEFIAYSNGINNGTITADALLINDINLAGFSNISFEEYNYTFNGNNHTISGLHIDNDNASLFKYIGKCGTVKNLTLKGTVFGTNAATVSIYNYGTVDNIINYCSATGTETASGFVYENFGTINSCINYGNISSYENGKSSGIANTNSKNITNCINYGKIGSIADNVYTAYSSGISVFGNNTGKFDNCINTGLASHSLVSSGIVCELNGSNMNIINCINTGKVFGSSKSAGIVTNSGESIVSSCVNYADISVIDSHCGGIAVFSSHIDNCKNFGVISGLNKIAGIVAVSDGIVNDCINNGNIYGTEDVAGIVSIAENATISLCTNYSNVEADGSRISGVLSKGVNVNLDKCANIGNVSGGLENDKSNFMAGVIAVLNNSETNYVTDIYSTGKVTGMKTYAGLVAYTDSPIKSGFKYIENDTAIHPSYKKYGENIYSHSEWGYKTKYSDMFSTGELAWMLNTNNGTVENRGIWSQGKDYPVFADDNHLPVKRFVCKDSTGEHFFYTDASGYVNPAKNIYNNAVYYDEKGNIISEDDVFGESVGSESAYVYDFEDFSEAAGSEKINKIILMNSIMCSGEINAFGKKEIIGNNNRLNFNNGGLVVSDDITLNRISIIGDNPIIHKSGMICIIDYLETNGSISITDTSVNLTDGVILNSSQEFKIDLTIDNWQIVATDELNQSLLYDIYPVYKGRNAYVFLPSTADISDITISVLDNNGNISYTMDSFDFNTGNSININIKGGEHTVYGMQSKLPTLSFSINEEWGTIDAMNSCLHHDTKCFGDVRLDVLPELEKNGFVSVENDEEKYGTMEIKGRGNSTWSIAPNVKKPYQFKLEKKTDILGMGKHKTWIILKNDESLIKNKLGLDIANLIGLKYSGKGEFVDVFMNGNYLGNYLLCEKVEIGENRVEISDLDDEYEENGESIEGLDVTGGYLLEIDNWTGDDIQFEHIPSSNVITIKSPEDFEKTATVDNEYGYITNYMLNLLDAIYTDGIMPDGRSYLEYIDIDSFVRYFFHQEFLGNADCGKGSTYFYKDKDSIDPLLYAGPVWDHDRIYEEYYKPESGWILTRLERNVSNIPVIYNVLNRREDFAKLLVWYYENSDIRNALQSSLTLIDEYVTEIGNSAEMNRIRWNYTEPFDVSGIKDIMIKRFNWIDENYKTLTDISSPEFINVDRTSNSGSVSFDICNLSDSELSCSAIVAEYKDDILVSVNDCDIKNLSVNSRSQKITYIPKRDSTDMTIMLWDSLSGLKPITNKLKISK